MTESCILDRRKDLEFGKIVYERIINKMDEHGHHVERDSVGGRIDCLC